MRGQADTRCFSGTGQRRRSEHYAQVLARVSGDYILICLVSQSPESALEYVLGPSKLGTGAARFGSNLDWISISQQIVVHVKKRFNHCATTGDGKDAASTHRAVSGAVFHRRVSTASAGDGATRQQPG